MNSAIMVKVVKPLLYAIGYISIISLMFVLYINAFDPYLDDGIRLGSFCVASSILVFLIYRVVTRSDRKK